MAEWGAYTWWLLTNIEAQPLVVLQQESSGAWERDPLVNPDPGRPVGFWRVSAGVLGHVLSPSCGTVVSPVLADLVRSSCLTCGTLLPSVVAHPQGLLPPEEYFFIRPARGKRLAELGDAIQEPEYAYIVEFPSCVIFSQALRRIVEEQGIPGVTFTEPWFAA